MKGLPEKIRKNWLTVVLFIVVIYLIGRSFYQGGTRSVLQTSMKTASLTDMNVGGMGIMAPSAIAPVESRERMVVKNTNLSLQVDDVREAIDSIVKKAEDEGGFLVDSNLNMPEAGANGSVSIRIPVNKLDESLTFIRSLGVKVVSENVYGKDVTDQYSDLEARLEALAKTKVKFNQILDSATQVQDILAITREIINLQNQMDAIAGQQKYLEQTAKLTLVTVYLATDELALPYAPTQSWRPQVIFKQAVRSLIGSARGLGTVMIWIVVYGVIWVPLLILAWWFKRKVSHKT